jgi:hypothetical protein
MDRATDGERMGIEIRTAQKVTLGHVSRTNASTTATDAGLSIPATPVSTTNDSAIVADNQTKYG